MTQQQPQRRTILVTGAARRIGRHLALAFAREGYSIIIHYHTSGGEAESLLDEVRSLNPDGHHSLKCCDLTDAIAVLGMFRDLSTADSLPSVVVNNASCYRRRPLCGESPTELLNDLSVNFLGPFEVMRQYHEFSGSGHIINLLDYRVGLADPASGGYGLAKKSLRDATEACALAWAPSFRVNAIAPGLVLSPPGVPPERLERLVGRIPLGCRTTEADLCEAALFLERTSGVTGLTLYVDGGLHLLGAGHTGERTATSR